MGWSYGRRLCSSTSPPPVWTRAVARESGDWWRDSRHRGITTLLTTQYLEEADLLSDNIIVIDKGTVIAEGTADQLKARTGGTYCEVVPLDPQQLAQAVEALGDLVPREIAAELASGDDKLSIPAPTGAATLTEALRRLDCAEIELADIALRKPSLDDVFLALTGHAHAGDDR